MSIKIIACEVMKEELLSVKPETPTEYSFVSMELHTRPEKLHKELLTIVDDSKGYERIILGFGLCGGAAGGIKAKHCILTIPRIHDCISLFLGSRELFEQLQQSRGTFYLSSGWLESGKSIISEYDRVCGKYGEVKARRVLNAMYDSYRSILFINTGHPREKRCLDASLEVSKLLGLSHSLRHGDTGFINRLVNGPWNTEEFINIPVEEVIKEEMF
ncbi:hypothetical protein CLHUN_20280 [Ruminiclostridium hungatei]|uniref:DUF1638 domain-containing protein n=1 Tax=Ruminiclostridium hungatei TaxID=48256 RepID=A0A1V4SJP6_RUMHU|nr:DUF1638 domain-containing protein [Ruminiclostridium hungatei]OPX44003.1 hypothetical protein CLHUN_20280 [Ruminiclostridium hungatei]